MQKHFKTLIQRIQGCQMVCSQTKSPNLGKFWRVCNGKSWLFDHLVYFTATRNVLWLFGDHTYGIFFFVLVSCTPERIESSKTEKTNFPTRLLKILSNKTFTNQLHKIGYVKIQIQNKLERVIFPLATKMWKH
jgi:hypothetical protein